MKAFRSAILIVVFLWGAMAWAQGFDEVLPTQHNLSPNGPRASVRDVCLVCHVEPVTGQSAPSAGLESAAMPLWDPRNPIVAFPPLPQVQPPSGKGGPDDRPFGPSFHCLACHDGVLGNDVHQPGLPNGSDLGKESVLNQDITRSSNHPDSIRYPRKPSGEFLTRLANPNLKRYWSIPDRDENGVVIPTGPQSVNLGLQNIDHEDPLQAAGLVRTYLGVMHCDTCHNPHINQDRPFLRVPPKKLCLVCHQR